MKYNWYQYLICSGNERKGGDFPKLRGQITWSTFLIKQCLKNIQTWTAIHSINLLRKAQQHHQIAISVSCSNKTRFKSILTVCVIVNLEKKEQRKEKTVYVCGAKCHQRFNHNNKCRAIKYKWVFYVRHPLPPPNCPRGKWRKYFFQLLYGVAKSGFKWRCKNADLIAVTLQQIYLLCNASYKP